MSKTKMPIGERIANILNQEATTGITEDLNIWPRVLEASVRSQAHAANETPRVDTRAQSLTRTGRLPRFETLQPAVQRRKRLFVAATFSVFLLAAISAALLAFTSLMNPAPVSAATILAQAEIAAEQGSHGVHSTHAVVAVRFRNNPADEFTELQNEWWDQAPDKSRTVSTHRGPDNEVDSWGVLGKVGDTRYAYGSDTKEFRIDLLERPATTIGTDMNTATGDASSVGPFSAYDAVLVGTEPILGRNTYVLDLTLKGGLENTPSRLSVPQYRKKIWVDAESYLVLQEYNWNQDGVLLYESKCQKLEINPDLDKGLFEFSPPEGYRVVDMRSTSSPNK